MKKRLAILLAAACLLGLSACGGSSEKEQYLSGLTDDALYQTVIQQIYEIEDANLYDVQATLKTLNKKQQVVYILDIYDVGLQNGGLCQFFMNDGSEVAPLVSAALKTLGAADHRALYDSFLADNGIDAAVLKTLSESDIDSFEQQYSSYPYEAFDDAYSELPPLYDMLTAYIRSNLSAFA